MKVRTFEWHGQTIALADWAVYVARDKLGRWHQFDRKPEPNRRKGMYIVERGSLQALLTPTGIPDPNWQSSLIEIDVMLKPKLEAVAKRKAAVVAEKAAKKKAAPAKKKPVKKEGK
jgi:hypothetical protein